MYEIRNDVADSEGLCPRSRAPPKAAEALAASEEKTGRARRDPPYLMSTHFPHFPFPIIS